MVDAPENAYHGGIDFAEIERAGLTPDQMVDFSANSNPFGPVDSVTDVVKKTEFTRYPDKECIALRRLLATQLHVTPNQLLVGNGTAELLWLIAFSFIKQNDKVFIIEPTFGEYQRNALLMGAQLLSYRALAETNFKPDLDDIERLLIQHQPKVVFCCNPNSPTGWIIEAEVIETWCQRFPKTLFVVDEAYAQFNEHFVSTIHCKADNLLVLRSMTKDYSLAGLRLGFVEGSESLIEQLARARIPWSVSEIAQAAGIAAINAQGEYHAQWARLREEAIWFKAQLGSLGYRILPTPMHYFLMKVESAQTFRALLLNEGLIVRLCDSFKLGGYVRISTQTRQSNLKLLAAVKVLS